MLSRHDDIISLSQTEVDLQPPISVDWLERKNFFLSADLEGNHRKCLQIAEDSIKTEKDIEQFYLQIIQPVMYEVGMLWERAGISVAQEHLASAIVSHVMATTSMVDIYPSQTKSKAVITAAPNEFHEIGAWMVSDILELDGWEVRYTGANTPVNDLIELLHDFKPDVLALSVTMPFNVLASKEIISAIRDEKKIDTTRIMVGGRAFNDIADLWRSTGADGFAANVHQARDLAYKRMPIDSMNHSGTNQMHTKVLRND